MKPPNLVMVLSSLLCSCLGDPYTIGRAPPDEVPVAVVPAPPGSVLQVAAQGHDTCVRTVARGTFCTGLSTGADGVLRPVSLTIGVARTTIQRLSKHNGIGFVLSDSFGIERPATFQPTPAMEALGHMLFTEMGRHPDFGGVQGVATLRGDAYAWTDAGEFFCAGDCRLVEGMRTQTSGALTMLPPIETLALGTEHVCVLFASGRVACWGDNRHAQCGSPQLVMYLPRTTVLWAPLARSIAAGSDFTCIVKLDGTPFCWGGEGPELVRSVLLPPLARMHSIAQLSFGALHACALYEEGTVDCWGMGAAAGSTRPSATPTRVPIPAARRLASGLTHTCATTRDGGVWCWGSNTHGELGAPPGAPHDAAHPIVLVPVHAS